jgi:stage II sporulation protein M
LYKRKLGRVNPFQGFSIDGFSYDTSLEKLLKANKTKLENEKQNKMVKKKRVGKKEKFSFREQYIKSWNYIKESRNFIYFSIGIFLVFALIGFFVPASEELSSKILEYIQTVLAQTEGLSAKGLIEFIFWNNLKSSFFSMIFGFALGVLPLIALIANGYIVGFVSAISVDVAGLGSLLNLLPHGIFELPAIFISLGLGLKFGTFIFKKDKAESFKNYFWDSLRVFVFIVLPLLIVAAIIEGFLIASYS